MAQSYEYAEQQHHPIQQAPQHNQQVSGNYATNGVGGPYYPPEQQYAPQAIPQQHAPVQQPATQPEYGRAVMTDIRQMNF